MFVELAFPCTLGSMKIEPMNNLSSYGTNICSKWQIINFKANMKIMSILYYDEVELSLIQLQGHYTVFHGLSMKLCVVTF